MQENVLINLMYSFETNIDIFENKGKTFWIKWDFQQYHAEDKFKCYKLSSIQPKADQRLCCTKCVFCDIFPQELFIMVL